MRSTSTLCSARPVLGAALAGDDDDVDNSNRADESIFIDRDPVLFGEILFFMRGSTLRSGTKRNRDIPKDLSTEAEFYSYDYLKTACEEALGYYKIAKKRIFAAPSVDEGKVVVSVEPGHAVCIASASMYFGSIDGSVRLQATGQVALGVLESGDGSLDILARTDLTEGSAATDRNYRYEIEKILYADSDGHVTLQGGGCGWLITYTVGPLDLLQSYGMH